MGLDALLTCAHRQAAYRLLKRKIGWGDRSNRQSQSQFIEIYGNGSRSTPHSQSPSRGLYSSFLVKLMDSIFPRCITLRVFILVLFSASFIQGWFFIFFEGHVVFPRNHESASGIVPRQARSREHKLDLGN